MLFYWSALLYTTIINTTRHKMQSQFFKVTVDEFIYIEQLQGKALKNKIKFLPKHIRNDIKFAF
jgi:predicted secreted protein